MGKKNSKGGHVKSFILVLFLTAFSLPEASAANAFIKRDARCACERGAGDSFEVPMRYTAGAFRGQCANTCRFRPTKVLEESARQVRFANFLHKSRYWQAELNPSDVVAVDVGFEEFYYGISHVFLRFRVAGASVDLRSQRNADLGSAAGAVGDFVFSPEAVDPRGQEYSLVHGAVGDYVFTYRLLSLEQMKQRIVGENHHHVRMYRLALNREERESLVRLAIGESERQGMGIRYFLLTRNCATAVTDLLQVAGGLPPEWRNDPQRAVPYGETAGTLHWIRSAGLLDSSVTLPALEKE